MNESTNPGSGMLPDSKRLRAPLAKTSSLFGTPSTWVAFATLVLLLDYVSGPSINLTVFLFIPVVVAAWHRGLRWALPLAVVPPAFRFLFEWNWELHWTLTDAASNAFVRMLVLVGFGLVTSKLAVSERRLRDSEMLYQSLVENVPQGIFRKDSAGRFTFANRRFCENLKKPLKEVIGKTDTDLFPPDLSAKYLHGDRGIMETGRNFETVEECHPLHEKPVYTHVIKTPLRDAAGKIVGIQGIYWDISEQRLLQDQLRQAQKMEAVGQLAGGVAHNFNNMLAAMMISVELMLAQDRVDAEQRALLEELKTGIKRAARLTRQLLLFSRPAPMETRAVDLKMTVESSLEMLRRLIGEQVVLRVCCQDGPVTVDADEAMIEQVILNLAINARDAMPHGGVLRISTEQSTVGPEAVAINPEAKTGQFAILEVSDTGCGMNKATLERIFEPFFTTKEIGKGTGLGLAMVHGIVKRHNGWVEVKSQLNCGSSIRVYLPLSDGSMTAEIDGEATLRDLPQGTETILLVEGEIPVRAKVAKWLRRCGYQVLEAGSGPEAETVWEKHTGKIQLLFSDIVMPGGISGTELAEKLRSRKSGLRVILWSGHSTDLAQLSEGAPPASVTFLSKPCPPPEIARAIRKCLDG